MASINRPSGAKTGESPAINVILNWTSLLKK